MSLPPWHEEAIARSHDRKGFDCGDCDMNTFLQRFARQGLEQNAVKTFCVVAADAPDKIRGFYSRAPASVEHGLVSPAMTKGLARHNVPAFLLARLAVGKSMSGRGLGGQLLLAPALRCIGVTDEIGGVLTIIDAKSERAANWYASYGAEPLKDCPLTPVVSLAVLAETLKTSGHF